MDSVRKLEGKWTISGRESAKEAKTFPTAKVIVANGLTSAPNLPNFSGREIFKVIVLHQQDFGQSSFLPCPEVEHITVLGRAKVAADMVYTSVKSGKSVSWVIKASRVGPGFSSSVMPNTESSGPYRYAHEIASTIMAATLTLIFFADSRWMKVLHGTRLGPWLVKNNWSEIDIEARNEVKSAGKKALKGFEELDIIRNKDSPRNLTPQYVSITEPILINLPDFWDTIAPNVHIHNSDIISLSTRHAHLGNGETPPTSCSGAPASHPLFRSSLFPFTQSILHGRERRGTSRAGTR